MLVIDQILLRHEREYLDALKRPQAKGKYGSHYISKLEIDLDETFGKKKKSKEYIWGCQYFLPNIYVAYKSF